MRTVLFYLVMFIASALTGQRIIPSTDSFKVTGKVKMEQTISLADLDTMTSVHVEDQVIYNHKGEVKDTLTGLKGVPLKNILSRIEFVYEKPKELNEFYLVMVASDGYKVVFSWNEIYNTEAGNHFFILTQLNGKSLATLEERIPFISTADVQTGRRYVKGLDRIEIKRVD